MSKVDRSIVIRSEHEIEEQLRSQLVREIERRGLDEEELAARLGMLHTSVELLMERKRWPLELGLRVAKGLNMKVDIQATSAD